MATELELKLALAPQDVAALRRHPLLAGAKPTRQRLLNTYFDTPELALAKARMTLRLRHIGGVGAGGGTRGRPDTSKPGGGGVRRSPRGGKWLQTLKAGGAAAGGLHQRNEWEYPLPRGKLDLALFPAGVLDQADGSAGRVADRLESVFTTDFVRTVWLVRPAPGTCIEVVLDQGRIFSAVRGRRELPISELELELKAGDAAALYAFAAGLQQGIALRPDSVSKAERGYRLLDGRAGAQSGAEGLQAVRFKPPRIDASTPPAAVLRLTVGACLAQAEANAAGVLQSSRDSEFVHQARVALRRMRACLQLAEKINPHDACVTELGAGIRPVGRALGEARDWDVLTEQILPQLLRAWEVQAGTAAGGATLLASARRRRNAAYAGARDALAGAPWCITQLALSQWLAGAGAPEGGAPGVVAFAAVQLAVRDKRLSHHSRRLAQKTPDERHRVRIHAKHLRYDVEMFGSLFAARPLRSYLDALTVLQDALGRANDARRAAQLIVALVPAPALARFAARWLERCEARAVNAAQKARKRLAARKRFWPDAAKAG